MNEAIESSMDLKQISNKKSDETNSFKTMLKSGSSGTESALGQMCGTIGQQYYIKKK